MTRVTKDPGVECSTTMRAAIGLIKRVYKKKSIRKEAIKVLLQRTTPTIQLATGTYAPSCPKGREN